MKLLLISVFIFLSAQLPKCQQTVLDPPPSALSWKSTNAANIASYFPVVASIGYDTYKSWKSADRKRAFIFQATRAGIDISTAEIIKRIVHRERPDRSDNKSFYSEHTELSAMGVSWQVSIPLAASSGYLRTAANKHYLTDVLVGLGVGALTGRFVK